MTDHQEKEKEEEVDHDDDDRDARHREMREREKGDRLLESADSQAGNQRVSQCVMSDVCLHRTMGSRERAREREALRIADRISGEV